MGHAWAFTPQEWGAAPCTLLPGEVLSHTPEDICPLRCPEPRTESLCPARMLQRKNHLSRVGFGESVGWRACSRITRRASLSSRCHVGEGPRCPAAGCVSPSVPVTFAHKVAHSFSHWQRKIFFC